MFMTANYLPSPVATKHPHQRVHHGYTFVDNYEWLRDKDNPETLSYLEQENAYTAQETQNLNTLQDNIYTEIKSRTKETDMSVPVRAGKYWYYGRTEEGKSYGYSCRIPVAEGSDAWVPPSILEGAAAENEEIILDANELAKGFEFFALGASTVTTSGRFLAYSTDTEGDERFNLRVKDLDKNLLLDDVLTDIYYGATWVGEDYLFYQRVDDAWRPDSVWRHRIGTPVTEDVLVYQEDDERYSTWVGTTRSEKYILLGSSSKLTSEVSMIPFDQPEAQPQVLIPRTSGVDYDVDHAVVGGEDVWLITHNATGANYAVGWVKVNELQQLSDLHTLVAHREDTRIEGLDSYQHQLILGYRRGAIGRIAVMKLPASGFGEFTELEFEEELYSVGSAGNPEWDAPVIRMSYGSFTTPAEVFDYEVSSGKRTLLKKQEVLGDFNQSDYTAKRIWVTARDGVDIPVSLVYRTDIDLSHPNPTLLYGYGAYEYSIDPSFSVARLSLLDRGLIFAIAHVRGGGELGRIWYDSGKELHKKNTFTDFIDVADSLISEKVTSPELLVANGGSAGGLLMGAIANMGGDRFKAIEADVPFVDPLTSILKPELPLTVIEWEEWGNPLADKTVYEYMASYAPYENIATQRYPNILAVTSLNDTRVLYVEPAKWIAKLRDTAESGKFLLKTEMVAGHGGVSGRYEKWRETAFEYAWLINQAAGVNS